MDERRPLNQLGTLNEKEVEERFRKRILNAIEGCYTKLQVIFTADEPAIDLAADMSSLEIDNQSNLNTLSEFPLFSEFPKEIQLQIWKQALPAPRLITITDSNYIDLLLRPAEEHENTFRSFTTYQENIGMLTACNDSREIVLKHYPHRLHSANQDSEIRFHADDVFEIEDLTYLVDNAGANILRMSNLDLMAPDLSKIQTLVLIRRPEGGDELVMNNLLQQGLFDRFMSVFSGLKRVVLVYDHERVVHQGSVKWHDNLLSLAQLKVGFEKDYAQARRDGHVHRDAPEIKIVGHGSAEELLPAKTTQWLSLLAAQVSKVEGDK